MKPQKPPMPLVCAGCGRRPEQIGSYVQSAWGTGMTPDEYVWAEEGTLNQTTGQFLCDDCYIAQGQPSNRAASGRNWTPPT